MRRHDNNRPDTRALRHIGLDAVLDRHQLEQLALHTDDVEVSRGAVLATAGRRAREFIAVIDGAVDVIDTSGRTEVAGPGTHIGGVELLNRRPYEATFVTRTDCLIVVILGRALASTLRQPGVASWVEQHGAARGSAIAVSPATRSLDLVG